MLMDFQPSEQGGKILQTLKTFMNEELLPIEAQYYADLKAAEDGWVVLPIVEELKAKAKALGLWNLFYQKVNTAQGLVIVITP